MRRGLARRPARTWSAARWRTGFGTPSKPRSRGFAHLRKFVECEGHARVPQTASQDDFRLGDWVAVQRNAHGKGRLDPERRVLFLGVFGGGFAIAYSFYCLSIASAEEFGEQQRTAFDLYRDKLLEQWPSVADIGDERAAFGEMEAFVVYNTPPSWAHPQEAHHARRVDGPAKEA